MNTYIKPSLVPGCFASGLPASQAAVIAATQRPLAAGAFGEPSGTPAWKTIPSWAVIGTADKVVPAALLESIAKRAKAHITKVRIRPPVPDLQPRRRHPGHRQGRPRHRLTGRRHQPAGAPHNPFHRSGHLPATCLPPYPDRAPVTERDCGDAKQAGLLGAGSALLQDRCRSCGLGRSVQRSHGLALEPPAGCLRPGLLTTCQPVGSSPWRGSKEARTPDGSLK